MSKWADVREGYNNTLNRKTHDPQVLRDVRLILADADALLAVVRADLEIERMKSMTPRDITPKALRLAQQGRDKAIDALPEHLKAP